MPEKYQREIEEILLRTASKLRRQRKVRLSEWLWHRLTSAFRDLYRYLSPIFAPERLLLLSFIMFLCALVTRALIPTLTTYFAMAELLLFIGSYVSYFKRSAPSEKRWRGQGQGERHTRLRWLRRLFRR